MIQVCSQCGTRWNVRERQRQWCPRCHGTLHAPSPTAADAQWRPSAPALPPSSQHGQGTAAPPQRLPQGYRWIAVRPGAAPRRQRVKRPLGPTPRYSSIPRWGLVEHFDVADPHQVVARRGPAASTVRIVLIATVAVLGVAALAHIARYGLLLVNRTMLLNKILAGVVTWLGVLASVAVLFMMVAAAVVLANWLIGRRAAAWAQRGQTDPRNALEIRMLCLFPVLNLFAAPVLVFELASCERRVHHLRRDIVVWWVLWLVSYILSLAAVFTSFSTDAQGIANNTVTTIIAYLAAMAAWLMVARVVHDFESTPVERPLKRWVIAGNEPATASAPHGRPDTPSEDSERDGQESVAPVESEGQNPAA